MALPEGWPVTVSLAAAAALEVAVAPPEQVQGPRMLLGVCMVVGILPFAARIRRPITALLLGSLILVIPMLVWGASQLAVPALALAVGIFACGRYGRLPRSAVAIPLGAGMTVLHTALDPLTDVSEAWVWSLNTIWVFGLGAWFQAKERLNRALWQQGKERARAAAAEERLTIARDLHDVLAHSLTVMTVQAEAATVLLVDRPDEARTAMEAVGDTGRGALREIRRLLPALREGSERDDMAAGLDEVLQSLVKRMEQASLRVVVDKDPDLPELAPEVVACLHHAVREALTNSLRYSAAETATVTIRVGDDWVEAQVDDPGPAKAVQGGLEGSGRGLPGMAERVRALGGDVTAGPQGAGFRVVAHIPALVSVP